MKTYLCVLSLLFSLSVLCACVESTFENYTYDSDYDKAVEPDGDKDAAEEDSDGLFEDGDDPLTGDEDVVEDGDNRDPIYKVEPLDLYFGCVRAGSNVIRSVSIENFGPERSIVVSYRLSSASTPHYYIVPEDVLGENDNYVLRPGGKLQVEIGYLGSGRPGLIGQLEVNINFSPEPFVVYLHNENFDHPQIQLSSEGEMDFGRVASNRYVEMPLQITNTLLPEDGCANLEVFDFRLHDPNNDIFKIVAPQLSAGGSKLISMGSSFELKVICNSDQPGEYENKLLFNSSDPERPIVSIDLRCVVVIPRIVMEPSTLLHLGYAEVNSTEAEDFRICNLGNIPATFSAVDIKGGPGDVFELVDENEYPLTLSALSEGAAPETADCAYFTLKFTPRQIQIYSAILEAVEIDDIPGLYSEIHGGGSAPLLDFSVEGASKITSDQNIFSVPMYYFLQPGYSRPDTIKVTISNLSEINDVEICGISETSSGDWLVSGYSPAYPEQDSCISLGRVGGDDSFSMNIDYLSEEVGNYSLEMFMSFKVVNEDVKFYKSFELMGSSEECLSDFHIIDADSCNYQCSYTSLTDVPDVYGLDEDCDGIDGTIDESFFVSKTGLASNPGTRERPLDSIQSAIEKAAAHSTKKNVLVATGDYYEQVELIQGVNLYGGYEQYAVDASNPIGWKHSNALKTRIFGFRVGVEAVNINSSTTISQFEITALPNEIMDVSTYGMHLVNSSGLIVNNCIINARAALNGRKGDNAGIDGSAGSDGLDGEEGCENDSGLSCGECDMPQPGSGGLSSCGAGGGSGGIPCISENACCYGVDGQSSENVASPFGLGGTSSCGEAGGGGVDGYNVIKGQNGQGGSRRGVIIGNYWYPQSAAKGWDGINGGGGGGGAGGGSLAPGALLCTTFGGAGGGGGAGGCGGSGGDGGYGGGSSFGVFVKGGNSYFRNTTIIAGDGGKGGEGRSGGIGGAGGKGGAGGGGMEPGKRGGDGGDGKKGGDGGMGGGGAGGNSFGIFRVNDANPYVIDCNLSVGKAGVGGTGGGLSGNAGQNGITAEYYIYVEE